MIHTESREARAAACGLVALVMLAGCSAAVWADDAARLRTAALAEEGDLLLEEMVGLEPIRQRERDEAEQLRAGERQLAAEVAKVEKQVNAYNKAAAELNAAAAEHARTCPGSVADGAVAQCNERGERLMEQAAELDRRFSALQAEQSDLNARVDAHNRARQAWQAAKRENAPRLDANAADTQRWVSLARSFMASSEFAALTRRAGQPSACSRLRLSDTGAHFGEQGLRQLHGCLKAVLRAI
jgi:hypothetical protein